MFKYKIILVLVIFGAILTCSAVNEEETNTIVKVIESKLSINTLLPHEYPRVFLKNDFLGQVMFDVTSTTGDVPENAKLSFDLAQFDFERFGATNIRIAYFNSSTSKWELLDSSINDDGTTLTAYIDALGTYAVTAVTVPDDEPPTLKWIDPTPEEYSEVTGRKILEVIAIDNVGIDKVEFYLDDILMGTVEDLSQGGWYTFIDFSKIVTFGYTMKAVAYDLAGNYAEVTRKIIVRSDAQLLNLTVNSFLYTSPGIFSLTGTIENAERIEITLDGEEILGKLNIDDGIWDFSTNAEIIKIYYHDYQLSLKDGDNIIVTVFDDNGNKWSVPIAVKLPAPDFSVQLSPANDTLRKGDIAILTATIAAADNVNYKFMLLDNDDDTWSVIKDYSTDNSCSYILNEPGTYSFKVEAKDLLTQTIVSSTALVNVVYDFTGVRLITSATENNYIHDFIMLETTSLGGMDVEYNFKVNDGQKDIFESGYSSNQMEFWTPSTPGTYTAMVIAREKDTLAPIFSDSESLNVVAYVQPSAELTSVELTSTFTSMIPISKYTDFTATAVGGENLEYQYSIYDGKKWSLLSSFGFNKNLYYWYAPTEGDYVIKVEVQERGGTVVVSDTLNITVIAPPTLSGVELMTGDTPSQQKALSRIELRGFTLDGDNVYYKFEAKVGDEWEVIREYDSSDAYFYTLPEEGTYTFRVRACEWDWEDEDPSDYFSDETTFIATPADEVAGVKLSTSVNGPKPLKENIVFTATATGLADAEYAFSIHNTTTKTSVFIDFSALNTYIWTPQQIGNYNIIAFTREQNGEEIFSDSINFSIYINLLQE